MGHLVRQMGHVAMRSADPEAAARDLSEIVGLKVTERRDGAVFMSCNNRHHEISFSKGETPGVEAIGLEAMDRESVEEVKRRLASDGVEILSDRPTSDKVDGSVSFRLPNGIIFEVHTPIARDQASFHVGPGSRPRRIEHVNLLVPDPDEMHDIITKVLGMKLSDQTEGGQFRWYRAHDGYHHTIALGPGDGRLHHYAFDLHALEDLAGIADTLAARDRSLIWGPGRHGAGGNVFTYFVDSNGCVVENSVGMDRIESDALYEPKSWTISETLADRWINLWGGPPSPAFLQSGLYFPSKSS